MKKLLSVLLSLTLALSLASCGGTDSASSAAPSASAPSASQEAQGEPSGAAAADLPGSAVPAASSFDGGSGTESDPYQIATAEQLALLAEKVNGGSFFEEWGEEPPQYRWTAIADGRDGAAQFSGVFDGAGHSIAGLYIYGENTVDTQKTGNYYLGLFGALESATIRDLTVTESYLGSTGRAPSCGGIAVQAWNSSVSGCTADILLVCEEAAQGAGGVSGDVKPAQTAESAE